MALWHRRWLEQAHRRVAELWRGVEAQHVVATMRLVDSAAEQQVLEDLLETSKPPLPSDAADRHYLLTTPFRYVSTWPSRFRRPNEPGVWYGADSVETACAEVGYWRWRFLTDSDGLREQALLLEFTLFQARVAGQCIDLTLTPWTRADSAWTSGTDYEECQRLGTAARESAVDWIRYQSVRDPDCGKCAAVFAPSSLSLPRLTAQQTWAAKIQRDSVFFKHESESIEFEATIWH